MNNLLTLEEYTKRYKERLISKWNKTPEITELWAQEASIEWFMKKFPNDPERAGDDDIQYGFD